MSGNSAFILVEERSWRGGLNNMLRAEFGKWWKSRTWWTQSLLWIVVINGILAGVLWNSPDMSITEGISLFCIFSGLFPAIAVVIIMQDAIVGEKETGTAAWVLSKPVSRESFVLSKWTAVAISVLVTMVLFPGAIAYLQLYLRFEGQINVLDFLAGLGVLWINMLFYLTLTLILGAFFSHRAPVIGIPLAVSFGQQMLFGLLPFLIPILPWTLAVPAGDTDISIAGSLMLGIMPESLSALYFTLAFIIFFLALALWRFRREEL